MKTIKIIESYATPPDNNLWLKLDVFGNKLGIFKHSHEDYWDKMNEHIWKMEESSSEPFDTSKTWVKINETKEIVDILEYKNNSWTSIIPKPKQPSYLVTDIQCWADKSDSTGKITCLWFDNYTDVFPLYVKEELWLLPMIRITDNDNYPSNFTPYIENDELISLQCIKNLSLSNYTSLECKNMANRSDQVTGVSLEFVTLKNCQMWYERYMLSTHYDHLYDIRTKFSEAFLNQYSISNE